MPSIEGQLFSGSLTKDSKFRVGIVVARFNQAIGKELLGGAIDILTRHGVDKDQIDTLWVPGAFEIPVVAQEAATSNKYDGLVCLGAVIRGETPHFDYVCNEVSKGISKVSMDHRIAIGFGVLTTDSTAQAWDRAGLKAGNKGAEAALAMLETASVLSQLKNNQ